VICVAVGHGVMSITVKWRSHKCRVHKGTVDVCEHKGSYPVQNI